MVLFVVRIFPFLCNFFLYLSLGVQLQQGPPCYNDNMLPSDQQIEALHRKYARTDKDFDLIYTHCKVIEAIAMQLLDAKRIAGIDRRLVHVGCMLHDIGAYDVLENGEFVSGVRHGVVGEDILRNEGLSEAVSRIASHHTGAGLTEQDVKDQGLPIPIDDYTAKTNEERLIMYADKFHSKGNPPAEPPYFCTFEWYRNSVQKFGADKAEKFDGLSRLFGKPDLQTFSKYFGYKIRDI